MDVNPRIRRAALAGVALSVTAVLAAGCSSSASAPADPDAAAINGQIIWADFGGPTNESRQVVYFDDFISDTGVDVVSVMVEDAVQNQMMAGGTGDYDATHVGLDVVYANQDNVIEIPEEYQDEALPENIRAYAFGTFFVGHAQAYLTETFPDGGPVTWADYWDTDTYPGKRAWPGSPGSFDSTCEIALLADGVAPEDLYPLDLERCAEKFDELRDDMIFYTSYPEIQQLLASGSAAVALGPSGQFSALRNGGEDVTISWEQAIVAPNVIAIPAQAPNPDAILALTEYFHDPERQAAFSERTNYGPGNPEAYEYLSEDVQDNLVNAPSHTTVVYQDSEYRAGVQDELLEWYTAWLAG